MIVYKTRNRKKNISQRRNANEKMKSQMKKKSKKISNWKVKVPEPINASSILKISKNTNPKFKLS
jgi:hypothetical protein